MGHVAGTGSVTLSVVAPVRDEEASLVPLYERVCATLDCLGSSWELLLVDDASRDSSPDVIRALCKADPRVRGVRLSHWGGQSSALSLGFDLARGRLLATIDADLQNDPADLERLLEAMDDETDAVVGYRVRRCDGWLKRLSSRLANAVRDAVSGDPVTDTGCSLKLFRVGAVRALPRFDGMHRFLPTLLRHQGRRVVEVPVSHHPRAWGRSKYGLRNRALRATVDLLAVRWMLSRRVTASYTTLEAAE